MNFQVVVSEKAQEELQEIYDYIADTGFPLSGSYTNLYIASQFALR